MNFYVDYIIKPEEGVVVCTISECEYNAMDIVNETTGGLIISPFTENFLLSNQYKGVAKCLPGDTFDEEYGKKLAYKIAYKKYATALEKKVKYIVEDYRKVTTIVLKNLEKAAAKVDGKGVNATVALELVKGEGK